MAVQSDVMHHGQHPRTLVRCCLMVESNDLNMFGKLRGLTPGHRAAGEPSCELWAWRSLFFGQPGYEPICFNMAPSLFSSTYLGWVLPWLVRLNHLIEYVLLVRWQNSRVIIPLRHRGVGGPVAGSGR